MISAEDSGYRFVPREAIAAVEVHDDEMVVLRRSGPAVSLMEARGKDGQERLAERAYLLSAWLRDGAVPHHRDTFNTLEGKDTVFYTAVLLGFAVVIGGLVYLTVVMAARSDAGVTVRGFVEDLAAGRKDLAYQRLTESYRAEHDLADFDRGLPDSFRQATGFTVNGVATATDFDGTERICIEGSLDEVSEDSSYAFAVAEKGDVMRIAGWKATTCEPMWWTQAPQ